MEVCFTVRAYTRGNANEHNCRFLQLTVYNKTSIKKRTVEIQLDRTIAIAPVRPTLLRARQAR